MTLSTALVTGANGFLGRVLVRRLRSSGCTVTALARRADDVDPDVHRIIADIRDPAAVRVALAGYHFDVVFHLAATGVAPHDREPGSMFATNASATGTLVEACARAGARAFVYTGSCSEYEPVDTNRPITEDHPLTRGNVYGASKVAGGVWGTALARHCGMTFCWLRLFGIYGPGEGPHRLVPHLVKRLERDEPVDLTLGEQVRDLIYVDDASEALLLAGERAICGHEGPLNVCSGQGIKVREVAWMVADLMHKPRELLHFGALPYRPDEPLWLVGDASRFRQLTGFAPRIEFERGIRTVLHACGFGQ